VGQSPDGLGQSVGAVAEPGQRVDRQSGERREPRRRRPGRSAGGRRRRGGHVAGQHGAQQWRQLSTPAVAAAAAAAVGVADRLDIWWSKQSTLVHGYS